MDERGSSAAPMIVILLATMVLLYVGSYFALAEAERSSFISGPGPWIKRDVYRVGGDFSRRLYFPINWVDRRVRRDYWCFQIDIDQLLRESANQSYP
jgi:hypothetical protein